MCRTVTSVHRTGTSTRRKAGTIYSCTAYVQCASSRTEFPISFRLPSKTEDYRPGPGIHHGAPGRRRSDKPQSPVLQRPRCPSAPPPLASRKPKTGSDPAKAAQHFSDKGIAEPGKHIQSDKLFCPRIDVNTASVRELQEIPWIGPVRAQAIVDVRPFGTIEDLKTGVGEWVFAKIEGKVVLS